MMSIMMLFAGNFSLHCRFVFCCWVEKKKCGGLSSFDEQCFICKAIVRYPLQASNHFTLIVRNDAMHFDPISSCFVHDPSK